MSNPSDDDIMADFRSRFRKVWRDGLLAMILVFLYATAFSFFWGLADKHGWLTRYGVHSNWLMYAEIFPILLWAILSSRKIEKGPRLDLLPERILRTQIDHYQRRWRQVIQGLLLLLVASAIVVSRLNANDSGFDRTLATAWLTVWAVLCALAAVHYPGLKVFDDERMQALRSNTAKAAFVGLLISVCAAASAVLTQPHITAKETFQALIWLITAAGVIPAIYYVIADWLTDREQ